MNRGEVGQAERSVSLRLVQSGSARPLVGWATSVAFPSSVAIEGGKFEQHRIGVSQAATTMVPQRVEGLRAEGCQAIPVGVRPWARRQPRHRPYPG